MFAWTRNVMAPPPDARATVAASYISYGNTGVPPPDPVTFNQVGNILGTPRTLKLPAGVRF
jgi:hypothetical protein